MHSPGVPVMKMTGTGPNRFWISLTADGPVPANSLTSDVMTLGRWEIAAATAAYSVSTISTDVAPLTIRMSSISIATRGSSSMINT